MPPSPLPALLALCLSMPAVASEPSRILGCADRAALEGEPAALDQTLRSTAGENCRALQLRAGTALECELARPLVVLGLPTSEIGSSLDRDGTRRVRSVFRASAARLRDRVTAVHGVRTEAVDDDRWVAVVGDDGRWRIEVAAREDGSSVLICLLRPARDEAGDLALGLDDARGGISGRVVFPGGKHPSTRVCAVPREPTLRMRCTVLPGGRDDYLITGLAAGEYDVAAWALEDNPNRWFAAYAARLEDCAPHQAGCAGGLLVPVDVRAGEVRTDIDPDRMFTDLPPRFAPVRDGVDDE